MSNFLFVSKKYNESNTLLHLVFNLQGLEFSNYRRAKSLIETNSYQNIAEENTFSPLLIKVCHTFILQCLMKFYCSDRNIHLFNRGQRCINSFSQIAVISLNISLNIQRKYNENVNKKNVKNNHQRNT